MNGMEHLLIYVKGVLLIITIIAYYIAYHAASDKLFGTNWRTEDVAYILGYPIIIPFGFSMLLFLPYLLGATLLAGK